MFWTVTNLSDSFATLVDSAEDGRNAELSFFWTSVSLLSKLPPMPPSRKATIASRPNANRNRGRCGRGGGGRATWSVEDVSSVMRANSPAVAIGSAVHQHAAPL